MNTNGFGLPQSKRDALRQQHHVKTGHPSFTPPVLSAHDTQPLASEAQNLQNEALQSVERNQQSGGLMQGY
jgi:hypothetical protein